MAEGGGSGRLWAIKVMVEGDGRRWTRCDVSVLYGQEEKEGGKV